MDVSGWMDPWKDKIKNKKIQKREKEEIDGCRGRWGKKTVKRMVLRKNCFRDLWSVKFLTDLGFKVMRKIC